MTDMQLHAEIKKSFCKNLLLLEEIKEQQHHC